MAHKSKDALPIPTVEIYARAVGKFHWACPNCSQEHPFTNFPWRRSLIQCERCKAKYQLGLGFFDGAPLRQSYLMGKWNSYTANRLNPIGTGLDGSAVKGSIEWQCPHCATAQKNMTSYDSTLTCEGCSSMYWISLLFYRLPPVSRLALKAPFDTLVKGLYASKDLQPTPATSSTETAGTPNPGVGGIS